MNAKEIASEMKTLLAANYAITKRGLYFTAEQFANEKAIYLLRMQLSRIVGDAKSEQILKNCCPTRTA